MPHSAPLLAQVVKLSDPLPTAVLYCVEEEPYFVDLDGKNKVRSGLPRARKVKVKTLSRHTPDPYSPCTDTSTRAHAALPYNICSMEVSENAASASDPGSCEQIRRRRRGPYVAGCRYRH